MTEQETIDTEAEVVFDCVMRLMANRSIGFCMSTTFTIIQVLCEDMPTDSREMVLDKLETLKDSIREMPVNDPEKAH